MLAMDDSWNDLIQTLAIILPIIAASLVILLVGANLLIKIRKKFNVKVNCWFCNQWTKVPYDNRNSFNCPSCMQYNGFDETGGYNREIPAQHDELLNFRSAQTTKINQKPLSNGLCRLCNNNQQLKIYQLANFIPMNEENYDAEIEHFSKQLENAYKLCKDCDNKLKQTLMTQHRWMFGLKIKQLKQQGLDTLRNLENSSKYIRGKIKQQCDTSYFLTFLHILVISFASLVLINALYSAGILEQSTIDLLHTYSSSLKPVLIHIFDAVYSLPSYLSNLKTGHDYVLNTIADFTLKLCNGSLSMYNFSRNISEDLSRSLNTSNVNQLTISTCGFTLQALISTFTQRKRLKYAPLVLWSLLVILSWHNYDNTAFLYSAQVFGTLVIIYTILTEKTGNAITEEIQSNNLWNNTSSMQNLFLPAQSENNMTLNALRKSSSMGKEDTAESDCSFESITSKSTLKTSFNTCLTSQNVTNVSYRDANVFNGPPVFRNILTSSPLVFNSKVSEFGNIGSNKSVVSEINIPKKYGFENYLNRSMDNLSIGTNVKSSSIFKPIKVNHLSVNRPLISPPRLKYNNFNMSNWNMKNFHNGVSRSSSQSSGFVSQTPFATSSPNNSICSDFDYASLCSEPFMQKSKLSDYGASQLHFRFSKPISEPS